MANLFIDFEWHRCPKGYRLGQAREIARVTGKAAPETYPDETWIVPNGAERTPYRPFDRDIPIYSAFARVRTAEDLLKFAEIYGSLGWTYPDWGESVSRDLMTAQAFRDLLSSKSKGPRVLADTFNSRLRAMRINNLMRDMQPVPADIDEEEFQVWFGTTHIVADPKKGVRLKIKNETLSEGLWWQLAVKLMDNLDFVECRQCGQWFETGPGAGRRQGAEFCSDKCRILFNSLKRSKGG
jgi:hypothetical protein